MGVAAGRHDSGFDRRGVVFCSDEGDEECDEAAGCGDEEEVEEVAG